MMAILIIVGQAGGNYFNNKGGGSNYLCLPNDPDNGKPYSLDNGVLCGVEYEVSGSSKPSGLGDIHNKEATCAVFKRKGSSSVLMIAGKQEEFESVNRRISFQILSVIALSNIQTHTTKL
jgi:hypothetical protein